MKPIHRPTQHNNAGRSRGSAPAPAWRARLHYLLRLGLVLMLCCSVSCTHNKKAKHVTLRDPDVVRYRLLLRENPVDPGEAFRCYGGCQDRTSPDAYMMCLQECPGFEVTTGMKCSEFEVPPLAACVNARRVPLKDELDPGLVVLSVIAGVAVVVALSSVCVASAQSQCGYPPLYRY